MTVNLTGVGNAQTIALNLSNVTDEFSQVMANTALNASFLLGDTNGDRAVNAGDALQTRNRAGQAADATNFRWNSISSGTASLRRLTTFQIKQPCSRIRRMPSSIFMA